MDYLKFSDKQMAILTSIDNSKDLVILFKRLIYLSDCTYIDISHDMESDFRNMLDDILQ